MRSARSLALAIAVAGASVAWGLAGPAVAGTSGSACPPGTSPSYPPGSCRLEVDPVTVEVGGSVKIGGCGFGKGEKVKLDLVTLDGLASLSLAAAVAADDGCVRARVTLAATVGGVVVTLPAPGVHVLKATARDAAGEAYQLVSDSLTLTAKATTSASIGGSLVANPREDGPPSAWLVALAVALVGGGLAVSMRRRRAGGD